MPRSSAAVRSCATQAIAIDTDLRRGAGTRPIAQARTLASEWPRLRRDRYRTFYGPGPRHGTLAALPRQAAMSAIRSWVPKADGQPPANSCHLNWLLKTDLNIVRAAELDAHGPSMGKCGLAPSR